MVNNHGDTKKLDIATYNYNLLHKRQLMYHLPLSRTTPQPKIHSRQFIKQKHFYYIQAKLYFTYLNLKTCDVIEATTLQSTPTELKVEHSCYHVISVWCALYRRNMKIGGSGKHE